MKNLAKLFGLTVLAVVIGLSMTACSTDGGDDGTPVSSAPLGPTLNLRGQVYTMDDDDYSVTYAPFGGSLSFSSGSLGGSGSVTSGQLDFTIGTPSTLISLAELKGWLEDEGFSNIQISPADALCAEFSTLEITGSNQYSYLERMNSTMTSRASTQEYVFYIYVDKDATVTATGTSSSETYPGFTLTFTTSNINMSLKKGWNAMHQKIVGTGTQSKISYNTSMSAANPSHLRWVLIQ